MKFLSFILPREDKFSKLLTELSEVAHASAIDLKHYLESDDHSHREIKKIEIAKSRQRSKDVLSQITKTLCQTYITPFDREDIQDFAVHLYKITKIVDKVRERIELHGIAQENGDFSRQIDLIIREGAVMSEMVAALGKGKTSRMIVDKAELLQDLELQGDAVLAELFVSLFKEGRPARDLILRKDTYDMLEKVIDRYRDVSNIAVEIVLKHS